MDAVSIIDTETNEVIYDSSWPVIMLDSFDDMLQMGADVAAYDDGELDAELFTAYWGIHPAADYTMTVKTA